jgi:hypothetical protein
VEDGDAGHSRDKFAHYRNLANRAHASAINAKAKEARDMYISIAMAWESLVDELEDEEEKLKLADTLNGWGHLFDRAL